MLLVGDIKYMESVMILIAKDVSPSLIGSVLNRVSFTSKLGIHETWTYPNCYRSFFVDPLTGSVVGMPFTHIPRQRCLPSAVCCRVVGIDVVILIYCLASCFSGGPVVSCLQGVVSCPPGCRLLHCRVSCRVVFAMVLCRVMWPNQESLRRFTVANRGSCFPATEFTCCLTYPCVLCSVYEMRRSCLKYFVSNAYKLLSVSAVRVQLSHPYKEGWIQQMSADFKLGFEGDVSTLPDGVKFCFIADMATAILILISLVEVPSLLKVDPSYLKESTSSRF